MYHLRKKARIARPIQPPRLPLQSLQSLQPLQPLQSLPPAPTHPTQAMTKALRGGILAFVLGYLTYEEALTASRTCKGWLGTESIRETLTVGHYLDVKGAIDACSNKALNSLQMTFCKLPDSTVSCIAQLPNLRKLSIASCRDFDGQKLRLLWPLAKLELLDISSCQVYDQDIIDAIGKFQELESLYLKLCSNITDRIFDHLPALKKLRELDVTGCSVTGSGLELLCLTDVTSLFMGNCSNLIDIKFVEGLKLEKFKFNRYHHMTNGDMNSLGKTKLPVIDLGYCPSVTDQGVMELAHLPLKYLRLQRFVSVTTDGWVRFFTAIGSIHTLDLSNNQAVTDSVLETALHLAPTLKVLVLKECTSITLQGFATIGQFTNLKELDLASMTQLDNSALRYLTTLRLLTKLVLDDCKISKLGMRSIAALPSLTSLSLERCNRISGYRELAAGAPSLRQLNLAGTKVTSEDVNLFLERPHMTTVDLSNCNFINTDHLADYGRVNILGLRKFR